MGLIKYDKRVAECVGLWLAEGSTTSNSEITFTNNCLELVTLFYKTIDNLFKEHTFNQRIYVYSKEGGKIDLPYKNCNFKFYKHKRATKPFLIFRIASVNLIRIWKNIVEDYLKEPKTFQFILRGFFAGEGNVHTGKRSVRVLRISQKTRKEFIDNLLNNFSLRFSFEEGNRNYILSNKKNWDIFARYNLADLHPNKKEKFWKNYNSYKEEHYDKNYLYNQIYLTLDRPRTTRELSVRFHRSFARIQDILLLLKSEGKIKNFRVKSKDYWTKDGRLIIISDLKKKYLDYLEESKLTSEIAKAFKVDWKSSNRRLIELNKLGLVQQTGNRKWEKIKNEKKIVVI